MTQPNTAVVAAFLVLVPISAAAQPAESTTAAGEPDEPTVSARYDKGFTLSTSDDEFELKAGVRSQFRIEILKPDAEGSEFQSAFQIPRLRLQLEGHAFGEANGYRSSSTWPARAAPS
jgi:hypothetical protein